MAKKILEIFSFLNSPLLYNLVINYKFGKYYLLHT